MAQNFNGNIILSFKKMPDDTPCHGLPLVGVGVLSSLSYAGASFTFTEIG